MREKENEEMKQAKLDIIKSYFNGVNEDLKDIIIDDDDDVWCLMNKWKILFALFYVLLFS